MIRLPVVEIFGPTVQGEGTYIGHKSVFIRFFGCDSKCSWCDTKYAWDGTVDSVPMMVVDEILDDVIKRMPDRPGPIILTGGNPAIHDLSVLVRALRSSGYQIHVETQGTRVPTWFSDVDRVVVSPKGEGHELSKMILSIEAIRRLAKDVELKMVVWDDSTYMLAKRMSNALPAMSMTIQPLWKQDVNLNDELRWLTERFVNDHGWESRNVRVLPQLHRVIWGDARGV